MLDSQATDLRLLMDLAQLQRLKAVYGRLVDELVTRPDAARARELAQLFTPDAVLDFGTRLGRHEGRAAIERLFGDLIPSSRLWVWHSFHNPIIDVSGDHARAHWTLLAYTLPKESVARTPDRIVGRYEDTFVRQDGVWLQKGLTVVFEWPKG